jgi:flagellar export protein FliJ
MQPFRFRLEKVLAWRRTELEVEQYKTRQLAAQIESLEHERNQTLAERTAAEGRLLGAPSAAGAHLEAHAAYLAHLERRAAVLKQRRAQLEVQLAGQQKRLLDAQRRCRLLERLRGRRHEEWQAEAERELENFAAEMHLARWRSPRA